FVIDDKSQNPFDPPDGYLIIEKNDVFDFFSGYIAEMDYGNEEKARSLISYSFTFLMEEISKRAANGQSAAVTDIPKHNYVERAKRYILNHLKERPTVAKVAENVYISSKQLNRLFKQKENISVGEYIDRVICIEAKRMLINKELNIAVIANNLGFSSVCNFSNYIKYHLGVTPSEIRDNTDLNETISSLSEEYK
ncbi:MAG: helix-turn-helix transcriptional regulator, partial [Clostridia bacterium]|nr:helix-turn-helix transcriptional regulator [Clostridia bacterium]